MVDVRQPRRNSPLLFCALVPLLVFLIACATSTLSPKVDTAQEQLARGTTLYAQNCATASCHGTQGEGLRVGDTFSAWPLVGKEFAARNPNAQVVFDVVRSGDEQNLRAMTDQQIYDAIAYEWSENGIRLAAPLTAQNALTTTIGAFADPTVIYPPLENVTYLVPSEPPRAFWSVANGYLELRVNQIARASAIGEVKANDGSFVIIVFSLRNLTDSPIPIEPQFLRLRDSQNNVLEPQAIPIGSAIEQFHSITIQPAHGTAAIAVFVLSRDATYARLVYDDLTSHVLTLDLK